MSRRKVDIVIISDVHLGTYGCRAAELARYLKSIQPGTLILNGDIIDIWQFKKRYWPKAHMQVLKEIMKIIAREVPVYYLTGNHDELLRKFSDFRLANFHLQDKLVLEINGKQAWFFHGDVFDASMKHAKWLAKLGGVGYDLLIRINTLINWVLVRFGREKMSFSRKVKSGVKSAISYIADFEQIAADLAIENNYDYVVCGHIHQPQMREVKTEKGKVTYLNSGDWVENLTALEFHEGSWSLFTYEEVQKKRRKDIEKIKANSFTKKSSNCKYMKVLYAIQGTGNGHLSRAREIIPTLQKHCELDLLVSGTQSELHLPWPVAYKCRGISLFYNRRGGIHYFKSSWNSFSGRVLREVRHIPVENYDLIINDFEPVSAWAARFRKVALLSNGTSGFIFI